MKKMLLFELMGVVVVEGDEEEVFVAVLGTVDERRVAVVGNGLLLFV